MKPTSKRLDLYWFSGSGNTLRAAQIFAARLEELGYTVRLLPMEQADPSQIDPEATFGLAFPTYCFSIPERVRKFVRELPTVHETQAIMLGTHGAISGGVLGPMKRWLTRKGFDCLAGTIVTMPDSFFPFFGKKTNDRLLTRAAKKIVRFAEKYDQGTARWRRWPILSDLSGAFWYAVFSSRRITSITASTVHVNSNVCVGCGICEQYCPVGAITMIDGKTAQRNTQCVNCLRCVALCPQDAMRHLIGFSPYRSEVADMLQQRFAENLENTTVPLSAEEPEL